MIKVCQKCEIEFEPSKGLINYCSLKCRNSRIWSTNDKIKKSNSAKNSEKLLLSHKNKEKYIQGWNTRIQNGKGRKESIEKICSRCKNSFIAYRNEKGNFRTWCSSECYIEIKRQNFKGSKIKYNGISLDSKWELELAQFLDLNNIKWIRPKYILWKDLSGKDRKYFPDFYLEKYDVYLDTKNPLLILQQREKLNIVSKLINLKYGNLNDLKQYILELIV